MKIKTLILGLCLILTIFVRPTFAADTFASHTVDLRSGQHNCFVARDTGSAALAETLHAYEILQVLEVRVHLDSAATQESFTATVDSATNAVYDTCLLSEDLTSQTDLVWRPSYLLLSPNDELDFAWTNTDTRTWGLEVKYRKIKDTR